MKIGLHCVGLIVILGSLSFAQSPGSDRSKVEALQQKLASALRKNGSYGSSGDSRSQISDIKFSTPGCSAEIGWISSFYYRPWEQRSFKELTDIQAAWDPKLGSVTKHEILFDLSKIETSEIRTEKGRAPRTSFIRLPLRGDSLVRITEKPRYGNETVRHLGQATLVVKDKAAETIKKQIITLADLCKGQT